MVGRSLVLLPLGTLTLCAALSACGTAAPRVAPTTTATTTTATTPASTVPPATTTPTTVAPTTTTTALPRSPQASDEDAAQAFVDAWSQGQRAAALAVATRRAVNEAFRAGYPDGGLEFRGCSDTFAPRFCSYGAQAIDGLVEIDVRQAAGGWYVTGVVVET